MPEVAEVFARFGKDYLARFGNRMLPSHRRAFEDIRACRTEALGGHLAQCDHCGHQHYSYHSCRNRSCPKCHRTDTARWLKRRHKEVLPVSYFHLVFTLPRELRELVRSHQTILYTILLKATALSLMKLARDPTYVGGRIGILAVLHTGTRAMVYHPHAHCLVPGGALSPEGSSWIASRTTFLVPVKALSILFRATFMAMARKALPEIGFPPSLWNTPWVVYCKPTVQGVDNVLTYLARYVHRIALTNNRIVSIDDHGVTFRYKDSREHRWKMMTLSGQEFIRRFLQHVLPQGFHKVRLYGILSPLHRNLLDLIRTLLLPQDELVTTPQPESPDSALPTPYSPTPRCPHCRLGIMAILQVLPRRERAPPWCL